MKGTEPFPSSFSVRTMDPNFEKLERKVNDLLADEPGLFLVEIRIKPTNNIKVYVDGDQGISIEKLSQLNRRLYRQIDEEGLYPDGNFSLEVSSPGLDEPLKLHRQYLKNVGREIEVIMKEGIRLEGKMTHVSGQEIELEETIKKGKKAELRKHVIPIEKIQSTKIQIKF